MSAFDELCIPGKATKEKKTTLKQAWQKKEKLHAEGDKLYAEGRLRYAEGNKLWAEGNLVWISAWIAEFGEGSVGDWDWGKKNA